MAAKDLTKDEIQLILTCIDRSIKGDKITMSRTQSPMIKEVYQKQEAVLTKLKHKLAE